MHGNRIINTLLPLWSDFFDVLHSLNAIPRRKDALHWCKIFSAVQSRVRHWTAGSKEQNRPTGTFDLNGLQLFFCPLVAHVAKKPSAWNQLWRQKQLTRIVSKALVAFTDRARPTHLNRNSKVNTECRAWKAVGNKRYVNGAGNEFKRA